MGLLPFAMLFAALRRTPDISKWQPIALLTRRFSAFSLASVAIMLLTGLINSLALVGSPSLLLSTLYGRVLVTKVAAFMVMIALGAMNLLRLKPRLAVDLAEGTATEGEPAARRLGANVRVELVLMILVMLLVGVLGLLAPAADAVMHERHH
jgi:putative copper resistance protein D